jgi:K+-sensing histidine kinase KdpD
MSDFANLLVGIPPASWTDMDTTPRRSERLAAKAAAAGPRRSSRLAEKREKEAVLEAASAAAAAAHEKNVLQAVAAAQQILGACKAVVAMSEQPLQKAVADAAAQLAYDNATHAAGGSGPYREHVRLCLRLAQENYQHALGMLYMTDDLGISGRYERKVQMAEAELDSWLAEARLMGILEDDE